MQKAMKICKICGKEYEACHSVYVGNDIYRWQDVACCVEHGAQYFELIAASRNKAVVAPTEKADVKADSENATPAEDNDGANTEEKLDVQPTTKRKRVKE